MVCKGRKLIEKLSTENLRHRRIAHGSLEAGVVFRPQHTFVMAVAKHDGEGSGPPSSYSSDSCRRLREEESV